MGRGDKKDWKLLASSEKERERHLRPSLTQRAVYFAVALATVLTPIPVFGLDVESNAAVLAVVSLLSAVIVTFAYHNTMFNVKTALMTRREAREDVQRNTTVEATAFSVLYNNLFFLAFAIVGGFFIFASASAVTNYVLSISLGAALATLVTASQVI